MTDVTLKNIGRVQKLESEIRTLKGNSAEISQSVKAKKIQAYAWIISDLSSHPRTNKGFVIQKVTRQLKEDLQASGCTEHCTKRYIEKSQAVLKQNALKDVDHKTVLDLFHEHNVKSEADIENWINPVEDKALKALAKKLAELSDEDREKVANYEKIAVKAMNEKLSAETNAAIEIQTATDVDEALEAVA